MSKKKTKIKSLGRLIVTTYPDEVKVLNQVYDVEEHEKTYKILKKTSGNQADYDVPAMQKLLKKDKVINGNTQLSEFPMSWSLNYSIWYELVLAISFSSLVFPEQLDSIREKK